MAGSQTARHPRFFFLVASSLCSGALLEQKVDGQALVTFSSVFSRILNSRRPRRQTYHQNRSTRPRQTTTRGGGGFSCPVFLTNLEVTTPLT